MHHSLVRAAVVALASVPSVGFAAGIYTENFTTGNASWTQNNNAAANWITSGGPNGASDAYITTTYALTTSVTGTPVVARATGTVNGGVGASGGAFKGSYANVDVVSFYVKHDAPVALPIGLRLGGVTPGTAVVFDAPNVEPNVWTLLTFDISPTNPNIVSYEGTSGATDAIKFANAIANVNHLQLFLYLADPTYAPPTSGATVTFSVDAVTVPEPATLGLAALALPILSRRRRA